MEKEKISLSELLFENKHVNNYTKLLLYLSQLNYHEDYYIPSKKLMNKLKINKKRVIVLLHQLEEDEVIKIFYKNNRRYFVFLSKSKKEEKEIEQEHNNDPFYYDWLNDNEN